MKWKFRNVLLKNAVFIPVNENFQNEYWPAYDKTSGKSLKATKSETNPEQKPEQNKLELPA